MDREDILKTAETAALSAMEAMNRHNDAMKDVHEVSNKIRDCKLQMSEIEYSHAKNVAEAVDKETKKKVFTNADSRASETALRCKKDEDHWQLGVEIKSLEDAKAAAMRRVELLKQKYRIELTMVELYSNFLRGTKE